MKEMKKENLLIFLLCYVKFYQSASSTNVIDHFLGIVDTNNFVEKRNSIVDGGVFVPYKSTSIVYKSRLVPVTYGFIIKKETLLDNPALYKLGVKILDEKVQTTFTNATNNAEDEAIKKTDQKIHHNDAILEAKSNCRFGSRMLRLLEKLNQGKLDVYHSLAL